MYALAVKLGCGFCVLVITLCLCVGWFTGCLICLFVCCILFLQLIWLCFRGDTLLLRFMCLLGCIWAYFRVHWLWLGVGRLVSFGLLRFVLCFMVDFCKLGL